MEGTLESTGKSLRMKGRDPRAELAPFVGFVQLVDPELGLYLVEEIDEPIVVHDVREGLLVGQLRGIRLFVGVGRGKEREIAREARPLLRDGVAFN